MKKILFPLLAVLIIAMACNNEAKDSPEKADSINKVTRDSALSNNIIVVDEESASFLVDAINGGMTEVQLAELAKRNAVSSRVKDFSSMIANDHTEANDLLRKLAGQKNVILPEAMSDDNQKVIIDMGKWTGKNFDRAFMKRMVSDHEKAIDIFKKALGAAKDPDVNSFADKTLMTLRIHLDSAKAIQTSLNK